jgi:hypothetical protein
VVVVVVVVATFSLFSFSVAPCNKNVGIDRRNEEGTCFCLFVCLFCLLRGVSQGSGEYKNTKIAFRISNSKQVHIKNNKKKGRGVN